MASNIVSMLPWGYMTVVLVAFSSVRDCNAQACGGDFTNLEGAITSPFYPNAYKDNMECVYVIKAPTGYRITLSFLDFILEAEALCSFDFLEVYDGGSLTSPLLGSRFCGFTLPPIQRTSQNVMLIRFKTDVSGTYRGFNASYISAIIPIEFILLASSGYIFRVDIATLSYTRVMVPTANSSTPIAVHYDPVGDKVYWTDVLWKEIRSTFPNGSDNTLVRSLNTVAIPDGMAVDSQSRLVFYTDTGNKIIALIMISTFEHRFLITTKLDQPRAIVLDTINGIMFWSDWGTNPKIERANYDGSDRMVLVNTGLALPNGLALDTANDRLYWADAGTDKLEFVNTMGNFRATIYSSLINTHYFGLALYNDKLYVTDWTSGMSLTNISYVERINTDGTNLMTILNINGRFNGIHIYSANTSKQGLNVCGLNNGRCSHICIPFPGNVIKCLCPDGQYLLPDLITCSYANATTRFIVTTITAPPITTTTLTIVPSTTTTRTTPDTTTTTTRTTPDTTTTTSRTTPDTTTTTTRTTPDTTTTTTRTTPDTTATTTRTTPDTTTTTTRTTPDTTTTTIRTTPDTTTTTTRTTPETTTTITRTTPDTTTTTTRTTLDTTTTTTRTTPDTTTTTSRTTPDTTTTISRTTPDTTSTTTRTTPVATTTSFASATTINTEASVSKMISSVTTASVTTTTNNTTSSVSDTSSTKSIAFSSTSSQSAATTPRPPGTVTIKGNKLFSTDGTYDLNLTCEYSDVILVKEFTWNVQCLRKQNGMCTFKPQPPQDDGKTVTCTVTDVYGQSATTAVDLELNYPPPSPPVISGYQSGDILQTGSSLTMTCSVKGGKPLADIVLFSCPAHLDTPDINGQNEVLSILTINPIRASDDGAICVCTAVWKQETLYRLSDSKKLKVNGTELVPDSGPTVSIPGIVGGAAGGVCVLIIVIAIVVVIIKKRKNTQHYDRPQPPRQKDNELTDPYTIFNQQFQNDVSNDANSIYNEIGDSTESYSGYTLPVNAVPRAIHGYPDPVYECNQQSPSIHYGEIPVTGC